MANSFQSYALALLTLVRNQEDVRVIQVDNPPLGIVMRRDGANACSSNEPIHNLLRFLIEHSPSLETVPVARLFIAELGRCNIPRTAVKSLVNTLNSSERSVSPGDWAMAVQAEIRQTGGIRKPLTNLASFSLACLVIGFRKRSVKKVPRDRTPNRSLHDSLREWTAVQRRRAALRELIIRRDGPICPVTGASLDGDDAVASHCAHIIPISFHDKPILHHAIEMFTGHQLRAEDIRHLINNPANVINIAYYPYVSMNQKLAWGIEARSVDNEWKYYFRAVKPASVPRFVTLEDGDEIHFGRGSGGGAIALPDPWACNLHLAIARVFAASGATVSVPNENDTYFL